MNKYRLAMRGRAWPGHSGEVPWSAEPLAELEEGTLISIVLLFCDTQNGRCRCLQMLAAAWGWPSACECLAAQAIYSMPHIAKGAFFRCLVGSFVPTWFNGEVLLFNAGHGWPSPQTRKQRIKAGLSP